MTVMLASPGSAPEGLVLSLKVPLTFGGKRKKNTQKEDTNKTKKSVVMKQSVQSHWISLGLTKNK